MSAVVSKKKRERQPAGSASARHSGEGGNTPTASFRTLRSGDPESSASASARHSGEGRNPVAAGSIQRTPMSWHETTLGEILPLKYGKARSQDAGYSRPNTQTFGSNGVFGTFDRALTERPSIIVGRKGAAGLVHYSAEPCWPIDTAFYTEGSDQTYLPFFRYLLESLRLGQFDRSTAIPSLSRDDYNARKITYPERIEEQRSIVAEIEKQFTRLDAGVAALRRVQANLKRYRAAVLKAACEGRLVPTEAELAKAEGRTYETGEQLLARILADRRKNWHGRGKYKEPAAPDSTNLPPLPEGWTWVSWETVLAPEEGAFKRGPFGSALKKSMFVEKGFKIYEQYCPINDDCSFGRYYITPEKFAELQAFEVKAGDYLISCSGVTLGRITRVPAQFERGIINQALLRVRIAERVINHRYFLYLFRSALFQQAIFDNSTGSAIPNVKGVKELKAMPVPLPPMAEQLRIVAEIERRLSVIEELEAAVIANLQRATRLRQAILHCAFSEKLG